MASLSAARTIIHQVFITLYVSRIGFQNLARGRDLNHSHCVRKMTYILHFERKNIFIYANSTESLFVSAHTLMNAHLKITVWSKPQWGTDERVCCIATVSAAASESCLYALVRPPGRGTQWFPFTEPGQQSLGVPTPRSERRRHSRWKLHRGPRGQEPTWGVSCLKAQRICGSGVRDWIEMNKKRVGKSVFHWETGGNLFISSPNYKFTSERQDSLPAGTLADTDWQQALGDQRTLMKFFHMLHSVTVRIRDHTYNWIARNLVTSIKSPAVWSGRCCT